jgi:hypothetical protein
MRQKIPVKPREKRLINRVKEKYQKYRDWINYNKDLLVGDLFAIPGEASSAQLMSLAVSNPIAISIGAVTGEYLSYTAGYALSSFLGNRSYYWDSERKRIRGEFLKDIVKFSAASIVPDVAYYFGTAALLSFFINKGMEPYQASLVSYIPISVAYYTLMNVVGHKIGIIKKDKKSS